MIANPVMVVILPALFLRNRFKKLQDGILVNDFMGQVFPAKTSFDLAIEPFPATFTIH
jgi:hypothetical protein